MTRRALLWLSAGLLLLGAAARWPSLDLPLDRDEGEYATLAWLWSSGQGLPYRDWVEQKPPASLGVYAVAQGVFDDGVRGLRWASLLWTACTVLALGLLLLGLLRRHAPGRAGALRAAALAGLVAALLLSSSRTQSLSANTEAWLSLPLIGALWLLFVAEAGDTRHFAAGFLIGVASLFKQPVLAGAVVLPWAAAPSRLRARCLGWTLLGAAMAWALVLGAFASQGAAGDLLQCAWGYNLGYARSSWAGAWSPGLGLARRLLPELGAFLWLAGLGWLGLGPGALRRALGAWLIAGAALLLASLRFYPHYAIGLLAPIAALAGLAFVGPLRPLQRAGRALILALGLLSWGACNAPLWSAPDGGARSRHLFGVPEFAAAPRAAALIQRLCPEGKRLFIWGDEAELYYLSGRAPASRYLYSYPFSGEAPPWPGGDEQLRRALASPDVGAAVLAKPLNPHDPLQAEIQVTLQDGFQADASAPPFIVGRRRQ